MYQLLKQEGAARRGVFTTVHGTVQTPAFMNVATAAAIKGALSARDLEEEIRRTEAEIRETYEKLRPGERSYLLDQLVGELAVQLKALPDGEEEPARKK